MHQHVVVQAVVGLLIRLRLCRSLGCSCVAVVHVTSLPLHYSSDSHDTTIPLIAYQEYFQERLSPLEPASCPERIRQLPGWALVHDALHGALMCLS